MQKESCCRCFKPKATFVCGVCQEKACKACVRFLTDEQFSFLAKVPEVLKHATYCEACFEQWAAPEIQSYEDTLEKAKNVQVFLKKQGKETRLIRRVEAPVQVADCADYQETILRLAFYAVQKGYNGLLDVEITSEKIRMGTYQTTKFSGSGVPAKIDSNRLVKDRSIWQNPN